MSPRTLGGQFCDDIRNEIGGKTSYIGCYRGVMEVSAFPITLPKLCASVRASTPASQPFTSLKFVVLKDDEEIISGEMPPEAFAAMEQTDEDGRLQQVFAEFVFSPLVLDGPCVLRVRAQSESGELRGLGLKVQLKNESV